MNNHAKKESEVEIPRSFFVAHADILPKHFPHENHDIFLYCVLIFYQPKHCSLAALSRSLAACFCSSVKFIFLGGLIAR